MDKKILREAWNKILDFVMQETSQPTLEGYIQERDLSMGRLREMLWDALENAEEAAAQWAYPIDIFIDDSGSQLFTIVAQSGKLFRVPLTIQEETIELGEWQQVKQTFSPTTNNRFTIKRQKDGKYRWLVVAATAVLNRVGEIDSQALYDSFIVRAEETQLYPRLDFYHLGKNDPAKWEFGTADYLARDGVCYIASGTFDQDHPLANAVIRACERDSGKWGCSIEYYSLAEPELVDVGEGVEIPVYTSGENTRISIVKEEDAANLFTRTDINQEKFRMRADLEAKLRELFGDDEKALEKFIEGVDNINRTVEDDGLIHRDTTSQTSDQTDENASEAEDDDTDSQDAEALNFVLDEEAMAELTRQILESPQISQVLARIPELEQTIAAKTAEIETLKKDNTKLAERVGKLAQHESRKQKEWLEDLPSRRTATVTYRPSMQNNISDDGLDEEVEDEDFAQVAERTLHKLPSY